MVICKGLVFAWAGPEPGRGFLVNLSVALGFVGLAMMGLQFALVARFKSVSAPFGMDVVLQYHRQMAYVALLFILAHPILLFVENTQFLALLDVFTSPLRATKSPCWRASTIGRSPNTRFARNNETACASCG